ncbi:ABC-type transport auxiliary lipoprotein family protein [Defluviimonas salinarum]|uniref:ABC-type transport auxiliary lipoprotein family protein n=1 Tax=Defluviimonas salinarum TaxID=2992147 RepID=A0ABT3JAE4_9RHOB|nr:ABC-type transport auxiliary lipoprotein family protein [Defluviimonas salinarum]MCW3784646.1 ABC-type transport auxiliary lipoprotein family protein [Defluviimonas salinarum]
MTLSRRSLLSFAAMAGLSGCSAVSAVSRASDPLDTYTLSPLGPVQPQPGGTRHLVVEMPTSGGELSTDRVLIKISPLQAEYLPDARWSEPTPAMVQTLLVNSLLNRGGFRLVSRVGAGLMPDYTLMCEIQAFQAELTGPDLASAQIHVALQMTVIREAGREIAGTRRFESTTSVISDSTVALIAGIDAAMQSVMADAVGWVQTLA